MPSPSVLNNFLFEMDLENFLPVQVKPKDGERQRCGCLRTSEKLKQILSTFPSPPPPSPAPFVLNSPYASTLPRNLVEPPQCIATNCRHGQYDLTYYTNDLTTETTDQGIEASNSLIELPKNNNKVWRLVADLVQLVQLTVTATALALYYLIYCYMQLIYYSLRSALYFHQADGVSKFHRIRLYLIYCYMQLIYYSLRSALYFHQADGPMKITIGVVSVTSLIVAFNLILRLQKMLWSSTT